MSFRNTTAEIIIIGGGIMGVCLAYYLSRQGQRDIFLLEKDLLAQASTGLCVGGIRQQFSHPSNILLSQETVRLFEHFNDEFEADIGFHQNGYLFLAQKEKTWEDFLSSAAIQKEHNVPVEILTPTEIKKQWPYIHIDDLKGGTFCPKDGYADPYSAAMAFADKSRKLGVHILEKTRATGILIEKSKIVGVETSKGKIFSPLVVNTAGPWGGEVSRMAGLDLPIKPFRRQVFMIKAISGIPRPVPMVIDMDELFYFRGEDPGIITGMSDLKEPSSFHTHVDRDFLERVIEKAVHRSPEMEKAKVLRGWGGLYSITPDENPIIGAAPEIKGLFTATGFSGHGFQHGPSVGRILSELILTGSTDFDLSPFSYNRFKKTKKRAEKRAV
jgi:sarcosine oxidase subunit beta